MHPSRPSGPLAAALSLVPAPVLARMVTLLMRAMRRRHPRLVNAFGRLDPGVMHVAPTDLPHRFAMTFGGGRLDVRVLRAANPPPPDAAIRGKLAALIDLLEGRIDGDSMFFSRDIAITGSTAVVVAVRNTLDREEIVLRDEIAALFGPLEQPVRKAARRFDRVIGRTRSAVAAVHASLHAADTPQRDVAAECDALRGEVKALKTRLARLDVRQMRTDATVTGSS